MAFGFAFLCKVLVLPDLILRYFVSIPTHEMGHAIVAWLGGRFALPLGAWIPMAGFTSVSCIWIITAHYATFLLIQLTQRTQNGKSGNIEGALVLSPRKHQLSERAMQEHQGFLQ